MGLMRKRGLLFSFPLFVVTVNYVFLLVFLVSIFLFFCKVKDDVFSSPHPSTELDHFGGSSYEKECSLSKAPCLCCRAPSLMSSDELGSYTGLVPTQPSLFVRFWVE